jgi:hypothetical protein
MPTNKKTAAPQSERVANVIHIRSRTEPLAEPLRSDNIRGVAPIPAEHLRAIFDPKPNLADQLRRAELIRKSGYRPSLAERLGDVFGSEFGAGFYLGVWAGALFTVVAAFFVAGLA